jgi:alpha-L-fucosidase
MKNAVLLCTLPLIIGTAPAQEREETYIRESDPLVQAKLTSWQDMKLGLMMTWGIYSQWGIVESWSLCGEDEGWCERRGPYASEYDRYKMAYRGLKKTFNPVKFDPGRWAEAASAAGMKYLVFTTKHHDGFCMFDTRTTDFKITSAECAFHSDPRANVAQEIFNAFREQKFLIGAYFSKPDWNCPDYWWPYFPTPDRHVNYDPAKHPDRWQGFKDYTLTQIEEIMTGYGGLDILWLDGAWVRPLTNMPKEFEPWARKNDYNQDVDMARIAAAARRHQPGLIVVDRWVHGPYENYLTPENKVPERALEVPWESCIPMATGWSYVKTDRYKSVQELVALVADVVAKGGNLLLNIAPSPEGEWPPDAYERLQGLGGWMKTNGDAIYFTRPIAPYKDGRICLTRNRKDRSVYAIFLGTEKDTLPPSTFRLPYLIPAENAHVTMLGTPGELTWRKDGNGAVIDIPETVRLHPPCRYAWTVRISAIR